MIRGREIVDVQWAPFSALDAKVEQTYKGWFPTYINNDQHEIYTK